MPHPSILYAIGDVHGEAERLEALHGLIQDRLDRAHPETTATIVHIGDYIDRGPDSCGVIDAIVRLQTSSRHKVIALKGNHEDMLLNAYETQPARRLWWINGGKETLESYQRRGFEGVSEAHRDWIRALPTIYVANDHKLIFVHAGVDPDAYPNCSENVRLWTRSKAFFESATWCNPALEGWRVVHGHTPTKAGYPETDGDPAQRINIDTGAVFGGRLTAAEFVGDAPVKFLYA